MNNYISKGYTIIFSPYYNDSIKADILNLYDKIIFSDFLLTDDLFEKHSNSDFEHFVYCISILIFIKKLIKKIN